MWFCSGLVEAANNAPKQSHVAEAVGQQAIDAGVQGKGERHQVGLVGTLCHDLGQKP